VDPTTLESEGSGSEPGGAPGPEAAPAGAVVAQAGAAAHGGGDDLPEPADAPSLDTVVADDGAVVALQLGAEADPDQGVSPAAPQPVSSGGDGDAAPGSPSPDSGSGSHGSVEPAGAPSDDTGVADEADGAALAAVQSSAVGSGEGAGGGGEPSSGSLSPEDDFPGEVEMPLVDHLEELRRRVLRSLLAVVVAAAGCLLFVRPLVKLLEAPAQGIRFLQLAPGEFLFVSLKVAGYAGLTLAIPWILFEGLAFVLPGLTRRERRLVAPTVAGSTLLFAAGLAFAWWALVPAALRFLVSYGADVVEPIWSIERYLDFVLLLMVATALAFQLPVLQLLLGALGLVDARRMLGAWRWVVLVSALAGAVLTPSTDPVTMLLLSGAITALYLIGIGLVAVVQRPRQRFGQV